MSRIALVVALVFGSVFAALAAQDPLAAANLTSTQQAAGLRSIDIEVNGENCRFCRINVERSLKALAGVKAAKADMGHHRARIVYDPRLVQPSELTDAVRGVGVAANGLSGPAGEFR